MLLANYFCALWCCNFLTSVHLSYCQLQNCPNHFKNFANFSKIVLRKGLSFHQSSLAYSKRGLSPWLKKCLKCFFNSLIHLRQKFSYSERIFQTLEKCINFALCRKCIKFCWLLGKTLSTNCHKILHHGGHTVTILNYVQFSVLKHGFFET